MVSASEGLIYYCTVFLTALVFLTEASAITTHYEKSTTQNKTNESQEISPQRTKLTPTRGRSSLSKQNHERVTPIVLTKLKSKIEPPTPSNPEHELLIPANSGGENDVKDKGGGNADDDDQKTLSEQVADGKYGLIQHEIFTIKPQRPGVISYDINPEVPKDNINNLGGLEPEDIWLAENHLLVLAGGGFNGGMQTQWRPIDDYVAPKRPVKIPSNPKVPPPFPIQLNDKGPIEYIKTGNLPPMSFIPFFNPLAMHYPNFGNKTPAFPQSLYGKLPNLSQYGGGTALKLPFPNNLPAQPPLQIKPPPGAEFIPPYLGNNTDPIDEDDPSLYYPPPYDFFYATDNTSKVPPGPLVPGIVLPPPPDFFAPLNNKTGKSKDPSPSRTKTPLQPTYPYKTGKQLAYPQFNDVEFQTYKKTSSTDKPNDQTTFITYDDIINEVTYPETKDDKITFSNIKANKVSTDEIEDWIPIPAPKPYYITGPKKPIKNTLLVMMESPLLGRQYPKNGYSYEIPGNPLKILPVEQSTVTPYIDQNTKRTKLKFTNYLEKFRPIEEYRSTTSTQKPIHTTTPFTTNLFSSSAQPVTDTIKATYYFYEEPEFTKPITKPTYPSPTISTTPSADAAFKEYTPNPITTSPRTKTAKPVQEKRKPTPMIPIYYLAELDNIVDLVKPMNLPYPNGKNTYYTSTARPTYSVIKPNYDRPTPRPIFEYNYVASDYNGPSSQISPSTPQPYTEPHYPAPFDYNPFYQPVYNPIDYSKLIPTTAAPILGTLLNDKPLFSSSGNRYQISPPSSNTNYNVFDRPWVPNTHYSQVPYPTDNPYYAFFTKEEEDLIDENTKKYFTIFGQKIRTADVTTPLPVQSSTTTRWNHRDTTIKYAPSTAPSQPATSNYLDRPNHYGLNYYTSTVPYTPEYTTVKPHYKKPSSHETQESQKLPISLEGDTLVNYVTPLPQNPDAELIPQKLSKHIRPIVVEDLPSDLNERLKNFINYDIQKRKKLASTDTTNKYRYVLVDNQQNEDYSPYNGHVYDNYNLPETYNGQKPSSTPVSLESDILVNYKTSKLTKNPDAEYIQASSMHKIYEKDDDYATDDDHAHSAEESQSSKPISLENDILVNYKNKGRLTTNPDAEYIDTNDSGKSNPSKGSSNIVSYKYPGVEHGHFYFLTPQETHLTQIENERYNFQSDVEKPGGYFKRKPRKDENVESTTSKS